LRAKFSENWDALVAVVAQRVGRGTALTEMVPAARGGLGAPLTASDQNAVEAQLGWELPPLLIDLYQRVGNGGFGPGYGLMELAPTEKRSFGGNAIGVLNFLRADDSVLDACDAPVRPFPAGVLPLVYWGCTAYTLVDCREPDLPLFSWDCDGPDSQSDWSVEDQMLPLGLGLADWIGQWALTTLGPQD
jgi:hypothetical protein